MGAAQRALRTGLVAAAALSASCGGEPADLDMEDVRNATYSSEWPTSGAAELRDGEFRERLAPGSASDLVVSVHEAALGDVSGDGVGDAAVVLVADPGGSGTFYMLHLLVGGSAGPTEAGSAFLGDRISLQGMAVDTAGVTVTLLDRRPDDPMSAPPTVSRSRRFELREGELKEVGDAGRGGDDGGELAGYEWRLVSLRDPAGGPPLEMLEDDPPTVVFAEESQGEPVLAEDRQGEGASLRLSGFAGCNRFMGACELSGDRLTVSPLATTLMMCPPFAMRIEDAFLPALQGASRLSLEDDRLTIRSGAVELRFARGPRVEASR